MDSKHEQLGTKNSTTRRYTRRKRGRGFEYLDDRGNNVRDAKLIKQFKALAIPPMWVNVRISDNMNAKVQAYGRDSKNRKQYIYCEKWQSQRQQEKFSQLIKLAQALPKIRKKCRALVDENEPSKERLLAILTLILDDTGIRVGNEKYTQENKTYGLTTLRNDHFIEDDNKAVFQFVGKGSKQREVEITDKSLISHIQEFSECPGYSLFRYRDGHGEWQEICSEDVNSFIQAISERSFTAKDFRTWNGTCLAVEAYHTIGEALFKSKMKPINQILKRVSKELGNTPAVCKKYYVHPRILALLEQGKVPFDRCLADADVTNHSHFSKLEKETLRLLKNSQKTF